MAMIKCPECGKEISDRAELCPNCGFPIREELEKQNIENKYGSYSEQELAKLLAEAIKNTNLDEQDTLEKVLVNKFPQGDYCTLINESKVFGENETDKREFLYQNIVLLLEYLDYPIDANGYRDWYEAKEEARKHRGYIQISEKNYEMFSKYYEHSAAIVVYDLSRPLKGLGKILCPLAMQKRVKSSFVCILKKNVEEFNKLFDKQLDFAQKSQKDVYFITGGLSKEYDECAYTLGDIIYIDSEFTTKTIVSQAAIDARKLRAVGSMLQLSLDEKKPMSATASAALGGAMFGTVGAVAGYAHAQEKRAEYEYAKAYNERIRSEQEKAINEVRYGDLPTKEIDIDRVTYGIKTYVGIISFYVDTYETEDDFRVKIHPDSDITSDYMDPYSVIGELAKNDELREYQAKQFLLTGEVVKKNNFITSNLGAIASGKSIDEIKQEKYNELVNRIPSTKTITDCKNLINEFRDISEYADSLGKIDELKTKIKELTYSENVKKYNTANTLEDYEKVLTLFIPIKDFDDSNEYIKNCNEKILELRIKKENEDLCYEARGYINLDDIYYLKKGIEILEPIKSFGIAKELLDKATQKIEEINQNNKKKKRKNCIIIATVTVLIGMGISFVVFLYPKIQLEKKYTDAIGLYQSQNYHEAYRSLLLLPDYKESVNYRNDCIYYLAEQELDSGNYGTAVNRYEELAKINYKNADELLNEALILYTGDLLSKHEYEKAKDILPRLEDQAIVQEYEKEIVYFEAMSCIGKKQYVEAMELLNKLDADYKDAKLYIDMCSEVESIPTIWECKRLYYMRYSDGQEEYRDENIELDISINTSRMDYDVALSVGTNTFSGTFKEGIFYVDPDKYSTVEVLTFDTHTGEYNELTTHSESNGTFIATEE